MTSRQITTFYLGDACFGVDILLVKEVHRHIAVSPIPGAPPHLFGLMNLRGRVVSVVDLAYCLHRSAKQDRQEGYLLIFKTREEIASIRSPDLLPESGDPGEDIVGFLIDRMDDVLTIAPHEILPPPPNLPDIDDHLIRGVIRREGRLVLLLNVTEILDQVMEAASDTDQHPNRKAGTVA